MQHIQHATSSLTSLIMDEEIVIQEEESKGERAGERAPLWQNRVFFRHDSGMVNIMIAATYM